MNNINIGVANNTISWPQNEPLDRYEIQNQLGINATDTQGNNLNQYVKLDLSRIDVYQPGTYHGSIIVNDPHTGNNNFMNFNVTILPAGPQPTRDQHQQNNSKHPRKISKKKKLLALLAIILIVILGITACHHHQQQQATQNRTEQQIKQNQQGVKSNAAANADLQKQLDGLKAAQEKYRQDHNKQAYEDRISELQDQNERLENAVQDGDMAKRIQNFGDSLNNAANDPSNANNSAGQAAEQGHLTGLWSRIQGMLYNWLNS